jgi:hypothetical protein
MKNRPPTPRQWIPVTTPDGLQGFYEVSNGTLTVRLGDRQKPVRASGADVPAAMAAEADEMLAKVVLSELAAERRS